MKMVEITENVRHSSQVFYPGERRMMEDEEAAYFINNGWGTTEGAQAQAVPSPGNVKLDVHNIDQSSQTKEL